MIIHHFQHQILSSLKIYHFITVFNQNSRLNSIYLLFKYRSHFYTPMDLHANDITYHSRKKKDDQTNAFTPYNNLPLKFNPHEHQRQPFTSNFGGKESFLSNIHFTQTPLYPNVSPITMLQGSDEKYEPKANSQLQQQRQKVRTLSQHLKSALMANNEVEERYNMLKGKMQEKQMKFMNETSMIKADMIILQKQFGETNEELRRKNDQINELKLVIQNFQKSQKDLMERHELQSKNNQAMKSQLVNQRLCQIQLSQCRNSLSKKDSEITSLSHQIQLQKRELSQYQNIFKQQEHDFSNIEGQLRNVKASYQSLADQNSSLKQTIQFQKSRIDELNGHIGEICQNSDHLFEEIKENQLEKDIMNEQMDKKEMEKMMLQKNILEIGETCQAYEIRCEQLKMGQDILDQKNRQILEKHTKLQEQNVQISRINTDLLRQIQLLDLEVNELKQVCLRQQSREAQLLTIIKDSEDEICRVKKSLKEEAVSKLRKEVHRQIEPTRDVENRRFKTQKTEHFTPYQQIVQNNHSKQLLRQNLNDTKGRFNYLAEHQIPTLQIHAPKQTHPYSQYLSFNPSRPYESANQFQQDPKVHGYTFGDNIEPRYRQPIDRGRYHVPSSSTSIQIDRKSRSFYVERKNSLVDGPHDVYKSTFNPRDKPYHSIKAMRNSLELREKSLDLHNLLKASRKEVLDLPKNKKSEKLYTQGSNQPQSSYESKDMFLSKLGKLKLWPKQTSSQQVTQRQALRQLPSSHDYMKSEVPIQTIIKQKSTILQQRKNMMGFNLNNQMIQKNILKLQKNSGSQRVKENQMDGLSAIREKNEEIGGIKDSVYNACRKAIYK